MLGNFVFYNPTKILFGENALEKAEKELKKYGKRVMLCYGGGSIKKNGIYDAVMALLEKTGKEVVEDAGVMPNPTYKKVLEGRDIAREHDVEFILAVGGGSVIDYVKAVSASVFCEEDPWEKFYIRGEMAEKALPYGSVLTMVGTGSEMNAGSVISNKELGKKYSSSFGELLIPKFSVLNPKYTMTLPKYQMVAGIFDIMSHILEQYLSGDDDNTSDYISEGLMLSLIHSSRIAVKNPDDYEARSNIMWTATWALNGLISRGKTTDWEVHAIGHAITAATDATHGMTLASVSLPYFKYIMDGGLHRFKRFAINVWKVNPASKTDEEIALEGLSEMEEWMREIGVVLSVKDLGVREDMIEGIAANALIRTGGYKVMTKETIAEVLRASYNMAAK